MSKPPWSGSAVAMAGDHQLHRQHHRLLPCRAVLHLFEQDADGRFDHPGGGLAHGGQVVGLLGRLAAMPAVLDFWVMAPFATGLVRRAR